MCTAWWNITTWNHSCNHLPDRKLCQHSEAPSFPSQWLLLLSFWKETIVLASNIIDEFYLFLNFFFLAVQSSLQDLSSLTRDWTDLSSLTRDWTQQWKCRGLTTGPPENSLEFLISRIFTFLISVWILLLNTFMKFIQVVASNHSSFIFTAEYYSTVWIYHTKKFILLLWTFEFFPFVGGGLLQIKPPWAFLYVSWCKGSAVVDNSKQISELIVLMYNLTSHVRAPTLPFRPDFWYLLIRLSAQRTHHLCPSADFTYSTHGVSAVFLDSSHCDLLPSCKC